MAGGGAGSVRTNCRAKAAISIDPPPNITTGMARLQRNRSAAGNTVSQVSVEVASTVTHAATNMARPVGLTSRHNAGVPAAQSALGNRLALAGFYRRMAGDRDLIERFPMSVSDTWNVMPTVNPRYAKS